MERRQINFQLLKFSQEFWKAEYQQGKTFAGSATVSKDASQVKDKTEILLSLFQDTVDIDAEIDLKTSLEKDSA